MNTDQQAASSLIIFKCFGYINSGISRALQKGEGMVEGLFVKIEQYAPKWLIKLSVRSALFMIVVQAIYAVYNLWVWLATPLAKEGFTAEEYAAMGSLTVIASFVFFVLVFTYMVGELIRIKWQSWQKKKVFGGMDFELAANRKKIYLSCLEHEEDYHPENWNQIVNELNERKKAKEN